MTLQTLSEMNFAGAETPESMRGISLKEFALGGTVAKEQDFVVTETMFAKGTRSLGLVGRTIRTKRYKYCVYDVGQQREQLFDMEADPGETDNLVVDTRFSASESLRKQVFAAKRSE